MMDMNQLSEKINEIQDDLRQRLRKKGLNRNQVKTKITDYKTDFLLHSFVNGINMEESTPEKRLEFYMKYLEMELKELN